MEKIRMEPSELIEELCKECEQGYGFVPLIGSGLSALSGIPPMNDIREYLYLCLRQALEEGWNPRLSKWPQIYHIKEKINSKKDETFGNMYKWIQKQVNNLSNKKIRLI